MYPVVKECTGSEKKKKEGRKNTARWEKWKDTTRRWWMREKMVGRNMSTDTNTHRWHRQVDLLAGLCTMPGNGMIVDCRGFDRGIWMVWALGVCVCVGVWCLCVKETESAHVFISTEVNHGICYRAHKHTQISPTPSDTPGLDSYLSPSLFHTHTVQYINTLIHRAEITVPPLLY